jgi:hypothetical protein
VINISSFLIYLYSNCKENLIYITNLFVSIILSFVYFRFFSPLFFGIIEQDYDFDFEPQVMQMGR